jgi:hypothetical protein
VYRWNWPAILVAVPFLSGLFLTLLSGFYTVKPLISDAEIIYFGFPFAWLEASRSTWNPPPSSRWRYLFSWQEFAADFTIYGILVFAAIYLYFLLEK